MTKFFFGAAAWPLLGDRQTTKLTKSYMGMIRQIVGQSFQKGKDTKVWSNKKILATYRLPEVRVILIGKDSPICS